MASRLGPAKPRGSTWNGAGAWLIFSQSRQVNFSRTCCTTFHCRGTTSSVSVTSSPSLASRVEPQHAQAVGPGTIDRSRGRCAGNGLRDGFLRVKARTGVVVAGRPPSRRRARPRRPPLRALRAGAPSARAGAPCARCAAHKARAASSRWSAADARSERSALDASARARASSASRARSNRFSVSTSSGRESCALIVSDRITRRALVSPRSLADSQCRKIQPAACGRHVCCGSRQSMPSRR